VVTTTREEMIATLSAIERELEENRLTIIHNIIDMNRNVVATYRRTVRLPRDSRNTGEFHDRLSRQAKGEVLSEPECGTGRRIAVRHV